MSLLIFYAEPRLYCSAAEISCKRRVQDKMSLLIFYAEPRLYCSLAEISCKRRVQNKMRLLIFYAEPINVLLCRVFKDFNVFNDLNGFKVVKVSNPICFYRQKQTFVIL